jgi:hypothetical protein
MMAMLRLPYPSQGLIQPNLPLCRADLNMGLFPRPRLHDVIRPGCIGRAEVGNSKEDFLAKAKEAEDAAATAATPVAKHAWQQIAETYLMLAADSSPLIKPRSKNPS